MVAFRHGPDDQVGFAVDAQGLAHRITVGKQILPRTVTKHRYPVAGRDVTGGEEPAFVGLDGKHEGEILGAAEHLHELCFFLLILQDGPAVVGHFVIDHAHTFSQGQGILQFGLQLGAPHLLGGIPAADPAVAGDVDVGPARRDHVVADTPAQSVDDGEDGQQGRHADGHAQDQQRTAHPVPGNGPP